MGHWLPSALAYIKALVPYWWAIAISASPGALLTMLRKYRRRLPWTRLQQWSRSLLFRRNRHLLIAFSLLLGIIYASFRAFDDVNTTLASKDAELTALLNAHNLVVSLVIDTLDPDQPNCHLDIINETKVAIELVKYYYRSDFFLDMVTLSGGMKTELPPNTPINIPGKLYTQITNTPHKLDVVMQYNITTANSSRIFGGSYSFFLDHPVRVGEKFNPVKYQQTIGDNIDEEYRAEFIERLLGKVGNVGFVLPERANGKPNIVSFSQGGKRFLFEPGMQLVTFSERGSSGELKVVNGTFEHSRKGLHSVIITWDQDKGTIRLMIDGKEFKDD